VVVVLEHKGDEDVLGVAGGGAGTLNARGSHVHGILQEFSALAGERAQ
jgi:hypothetical protein